MPQLVIGSLTPAKPQSDKRGEPNRHLFDGPDKEHASGLRQRRASSSKQRKVPDYVGHHINSVNDSPLLARDPNNIAFKDAVEHYAAHNGGRYRIPVYGELLDRGL